MECEKYRLDILAMQETKQLESEILEMDGKKESKDKVIMPGKKRQFNEKSYKRKISKQGSKVILSRSKMHGKSIPRQKIVVKTETGAPENESKNLIEKWKRYFEKLLNEENQGARQAIAEDDNSRGAN